MQSKGCVPYIITIQRWAQSHLHRCYSPAVLQAAVNRQPGYRWDNSQIKFSLEIVAIHEFLEHVIVVLLVLTLNQAQLGADGKASTW